MRLPRIGLTAHFKEIDVVWKRFTRKSGAYGMMFFGTPAQWDAGHFKIYEKL